MIKTNTVGIIAVGDELLYGQTLDQNSHWLSQQLNLHSYSVKGKYIVGDNEKDIIEFISLCEKKYDVILLTGGLGPTNDDLTMRSIAKYYQSDIVFDENVYKHIVEHYRERLKNREINDLVKTQAYVPSISSPIINDCGTAPGILIEKNQKTLIAMPGVPYEMKKMFSDSILPKLLDRIESNKKITHRYLSTVGISESNIALMIKDWEKNLSSKLKLAYLPSIGIVKLRLTLISEDEKDVFLLENEVKELKKLISEHVYSDQDRTLEETIAEQLINKNRTIAIAESCTGGLISHKLTSLSGASQWFKGSIVAYTNEIKENILQVRRDTLEKYGAVSNETVIEMAQNVKKLYNTDIGIAISGIAGPAGGTDKIPVGSIYIGFSDAEKTTSTLFIFGNFRNLNIELGAVHTLNIVRKNIN